MDWSHLQKLHALLTFIVSPYIVSLKSIATGNSYVIPQKHHQHGE